MDKPQSERNDQSERQTLQAKQETWYQQVVDRFKPLMSSIQKQMRKEPLENVTKIITGKQ